MKRASELCAAAIGLCSVTMFTVGLSGCSGTSAPQIKAQSDGTLALSKDGQYLYVASADDNTVVVVDPFTFSQIASIPVGQQPARIAVGPDGTAWLVNSVGQIYRRHGESWVFERARRETVERDHNYDRAFRLRNSG